MERIGKITAVLYLVGLPMNLSLVYFCSVFCETYPNTATSWFYGVLIALGLDMFVVKFIVPIVATLLHFLFLRGFRSKS